jgi:uncharacterized RDD family membrane protein YckC
MNSVVVVYAGFWRRFWAFVLDVWFYVVLIELVKHAVPEGAFALTAFIAVVVTIVLTTMQGGTVGKRMLGMRVVRAASGEGVGIGHAIVRDILVKPISILCVGAGCLWMLDSNKRQGWHDIAASTVVVREIYGAGGPEWAGDAPWLRSPEKKEAPAAPAA